MVTVIVAAFALVCLFATSRLVSSLLLLLLSFGRCQAPTWLSTLLTMKTPNQTRWSTSSRLFLSRPIVGKADGRLDSSSSSRPCQVATGRVDSQVIAHRQASSVAARASRRLAVAPPWPRARAAPVQRTSCFLKWPLEAATGVSAL